MKPIHADFALLVNAYKVRQGRQHAGTRAPPATSTSSWPPPPTPSSPRPSNLVEIGHHRPRERPYLRRVRRLHRGWREAVMEKSEIKGFIAKRVAKELKDGDVVNLGIGLPTMVPAYLPEGVQVILQSENGIIGTGTQAQRREGRALLQDVDAGGIPCSGWPTAAASSTPPPPSALIRGGHVNATILGAPGGGRRRATSVQLDHPRQEDARHGRRHGPAVWARRTCIVGHGAHRQGQPQDPRRSARLPLHRRPTASPRSSPRCASSRSPTTVWPDDRDQPRVHRRAGAGRDRGPHQGRREPEEHGRLTPGFPALKREASLIKKAARGFL